MVLQILLLCIITPVALLLLLRYRMLRRQNKQLCALHQLFQAEELAAPALSFGAAYGWDSFAVTFANEHDLIIAKQRGVIEKFKGHLATYYKPEFNPDGALYCTWVRQGTPETK